MNVPADFDDYFRALASTPLDDKTEHTDRGALETLLRAAANDAGPGASVQHEPRRDRGGGGSPDYKVSRQGRIAGYVEVKQIDENLSKVLKSDQIKKYRLLSDNIVLTDYLEFCWIKADGSVVRERLAHSEDLSARRLHLKPEAVEAVRLLLRGFFSTAPGRTGRAQDLALALAHRARLLRDFLTTELIRQEKVHREGRLHALFDVFRQQVFHELKVVEFADAFAQMLAYGLFLARLNAGAAETVTLENVRRFIPGSFSLIRELVRFLEEMNEDEYRDIRWVVDEVLSLVNGLDLAAIHDDLSFRSRKAISRKVRAGDEEEHRLFERDPFIYFYEDFLKAYDPAMRKGRGVYYTPPPIVNFIVRAVDDILKDSFGIRDGLADHNKVTVLDFACGTGTFLLEVFERIFDNIGGPDAGRADAVVREHITKNLFGFEYLIAPYTIAHLKLSQYLKDKGHPLRGDERLQVFLTNTLEQVEKEKKQPTFNFVPALAEEARRADEIKQKKILVITGNPPYSGHSKNKGEWITAAVTAYREGFPELSKPAQGKWLQDDYVKFLRFAQMKMDAVDEGIVAVITNHSWLDNPTFKGMRKSLMATFHQIHVLDLHGNAKKKERTPDDGEDQNVFDIEQGVAISLFVKRPGLERGVWHSDLWGRRLAKYQATADATLASVAWNTLIPSEPEWLFRPQDAEAATRYRALWSVPDIFGRLGDPAPGFVTTQDSFAISFAASEAKDKVRKLLATTDEQEARRLFRLCSQDQWSYDRAKTELPNLDLKSATKKVLYRPFDERWTVWDRNVTVHRRDRVMRHMSGENIALLTARSNKSPNPDHFFITDKASETKASESTIQSYTFPLSMKAEPSGESFSPDFRAFLDARYHEHYTPEEILGYIYAVLYAPTYRSRYAAFLRVAFPRIPFPDDAVDFEALSALGWALVQAHLLRDVPERKLADFHGKGDRTIEAVRYAPAEEAVWINKTQRFAPVPQAVWNFHIGGYQVLDKYLKSRKGRVLSLDEITHIANVADSLAFTIDQMAMIDAAYLKAFPEPAAD